MGNKDEAVARSLRGEWKWGDSELLYDWTREEVQRRGIREGSVLALLVTDANDDQRFVPATVRHISPFLSVSVQTETGCGLVDVLLPEAVFWKDVPAEKRIVR